MRRFPLIFLCAMFGFVFSCKSRSKKPLYAEGPISVVVADESQSLPPSTPNPPNAQEPDKTKTEAAVQVPGKGIVTEAPVPAGPVKREGVFGTLSRKRATCRKTPCGRFALRLLNRQGEVIRFDSLSLPDNLKLEQILSQKSIILFGTINESSGKDHPRTFEMKEAFAFAYGNPKPFRSSLVFTIISEQVPPRQCYVAPCPNKIAEVLNTDESLLFDRIDIEALAKKNGSIEDNPLQFGSNFIVAGVAADGESRYPGGFERIFNMGAIFQKIQRQ